MGCIPSFHGRLLAATKGGGLGGRAELEWPHTAGGEPPPPPRAPDHSDHSGKTTKFTVGKIWSGHFGTHNCGSQPPIRSSILIDPSGGGGGGGEPMTGHGGSLVTRRTPSPSPPPPPPPIRSPPPPHTHRCSQDKQGLLRSSRLGLLAVQHQPAALQAEAHCWMAMVALTLKSPQEAHRHWQRTDALTRTGQHKPKTYELAAWYHFCRRDVDAMHVALEEGMDLAPEDDELGPEWVGLRIVAILNKVNALTGTFSSPQRWIRKADNRRSPPPPPLDPPPDFTVGKKLINNDNK